MSELSRNYQENDIVIKQVANGWMLILPLDEFDVTEEDIEKVLRKEADIMHESQNKNYELAQMRGEQSPLFPTPKKVPIQEMKQTNILIFIEFEHLMAYLNSLFNANPQNN